MWLVRGSLPTSYSIYHPILPNYIQEKLKVFLIQVVSVHSRPTCRDAGPCCKSHHGRHMWFYYMITRNPPCMLALLLTWDFGVLSCPARSLARAMAMVDSSPWLLLSFIKNIPGQKCCTGSIVASTWNSEILLVELEFCGAFPIELVAKFRKFLCQDRSSAVEDTYLGIRMLGCNFG